MPITRRFLVAPALTRLTRKEFGSERVTEGYFAPQSERQSHIRIEKTQAYLVLTASEGYADGGENRTDVPRLHAEALLEVCPGTVAFERSLLRLSGQDVLLDRFVTPAPLDLVSVEFSDQAQATAFRPPVWFGDEVTEDEGYGNGALALSGLPPVRETPLSNAMLDALLDILEGGAGEALADLGDAEPEGMPEDETTFAMLRRLAVVRPADPPAQAPEVPLPIEAAGQPAEAPARRPVLRATPARDDAGDERLAGVIEGLSEALAQPPAEETSSEGELRARPAWRWSSH